MSQSNEPKPLPEIVVLNLEVQPLSLHEIRFLADCVSSHRGVLQLTGVATWHDDWHCVIDDLSEEKVRQAAKNRADSAALIESCEGQIAYVMSYEDPFRPEQARGMWISIENVVLVDGRVMAVWCIEALNGANIICSLPLLDECGRRYDRDRMTRSFQWILRCDDPIEGLVPRLLGAAEAEGQRLLDGQGSAMSGIRSSAAKH